MATIAQIKSQFNILTLNLNTAKDKDGNPTMWMRHWDNENRVAVSLHKDLIAEIKANPSLDSLGTQIETRTAEQGEYKAVRIVKYTPAEETL